jgi:GH15 family glucan-1,4-alpha-glucosidase
MPRFQLSTASSRRKPAILIGFALGALFGTGLVLSTRFLGKILRQPGFISQAVTSIFGSSKENIKRAHEIARDNLLTGIEKRLLLNGEEKLVLVAGLRNFREPWARDFGFASYGLMALEQYTTVRECLEVFFLHQKSNGQFPIKIHSTTVPNRYLHSLFRRQQPIIAPLRPRYVSGHNTISLDGNGLLVNAALNYINTTGDIQFYEEYWPSIKQAAEWLSGHAREGDCLLHQGIYSDWADSIARAGRVLYTNVIYWKAVKEIAIAAERFGDLDAHHRFSEKESQLRQAIYSHFWRPDLGYFVTNYLFDNLSSSGNLMAIAWGLTDSNQAESILDAMNTHGMADPVPTRPVDKPYPLQYVAIENRLAGIPHYHTGAAWLWLGAWHVVASLCAGRTEEAGELLDRMARAIVHDGEVHEVYGPDGKFLRSFWYTSEAPLTWSAGMFIYAWHLYHSHLIESQEQLKSEG